MLTIAITEKGGRPTQREFDQPEVTIGRVAGNDIALPKSNISKRHARMVRSAGTYTVFDLKSTNGTYVNGRRIAGPTEVHQGDRVTVGDFTMELVAVDASVPGTPAPRAAKAEARKLKTREIDVGAAAEALAAPPAAAEQWASSADLQQEWGDGWGDAAAPPQPPAPTAAGEGPAPARVPAAPEPAAERTPAPAPRPLAAEPSRASREPTQSRVVAPPRLGHGRAAAAAGGHDAGALLQLVHERLLRACEADREALASLDDAALRARVAHHVRQIVQQVATEQAPGAADPAALIDRVLAEALGMGPLQEYLDDPTVTEILVNHPRQVFVERRGRLEPTATRFSSAAAIEGIIQRIVIPLGRRVDEAHPMVDARLRDGSRVNAVLPPLAVRGPTLTVRKFTREPLQIDDLVAGGALNADMAEFLEVCVQARKNIVISGGSGAGKTTLLGVLSGFIAAHERIITIEDAAELKLDQEHVVTLEARPATPAHGGPAEVTIRELVRNALRMRPDRIVVGEVRDGEALDMLQAMNTGHDGSLTTVHANTPRDMVARLETMVAMGGLDLPPRAVREQLVSAVDIIVQQSRFADGSRRVTHISEIVGMEGDVVSMHDLFVYEQLGAAHDGRVHGRFRATGFVPKFYEGLRSLGLEPNLAIFRNG